MAVTAENFCRIEEVDGIKVLFYAEHEGNNIALHQIVSADEGTVDVKLTFPGGLFERMWPEDFRFQNAALKVVEQARSMGLTFDGEGV